MARESQNKNILIVIALSLFAILYVYFSGNALISVAKYISIEENKIHFDEELFAVKIIIILIIISISAICVIPIVQTKALADTEEGIRIRNSIRETIIKIIAGLVAVVAIMSTLREWRLSKDKQITEMYIKSISLLGDENNSVVIGALSALERIGFQSTKDVGAIIEVISEYVKDKAKKDGTNNYCNSRIQYSVGVISRLGKIENGKKGKINLSSTDLSGVYIYNANMRNFHMPNSILKNSMLSYSDFSNADIEYSDLTCSNLYSSNIQQLNFKNVTLNKTDIRKANLQGAKNISPDELAKSFCDEDTIFDNDVKNSDSYHQCRENGKKLNSQGLDVDLLDTDVYNQARGCP